MTPRQFIEKFREAFSDVAPLPIAIGYSDTPAATDCRIPRCTVGAISKVREGESLTLSADKLQCGGGGLYAAFTPMSDRVPTFVSETEHYKRTPEMVREYIASLDIRITDKPYLNFVRVDQLTDWSGVEALLFFATPDILSGLCTWAFYDNNAHDAVVAQFASGCAGIITLATVENRKAGRRCFLGLLDPSARPLVPKNELTFTVPMSRFAEMLTTMGESALFQHAYSVVRRRIKGEIG